MKNKFLTERSIHGFTLVELLVTLVIMGLAMSAIYATFSAQHSSYYRQGDIQEIQATSESVLVMIKRDLLHAGYGVEKSLGLYIHDGAATNSSDELFISDYRFFLDDEDLLLAGSYAQAKIVSGSGTDQIELDTVNLDKNSTVNEFQGDIWQCILTDDGNDKYAIISTLSGTTLNLDQPVAGSFVTPALYYFVDQATHKLMRSDRNLGGRTAFASHVYDLQIAYQDKNNNWYCDGDSTNDPNNDKEMSPFEPEKIALIRVSIVVGFRAWPDVIGPNTVLGVENGPSWNGQDYDPSLHFRVYSISLCPRNFLF